MPCQEQDQKTIPPKGDRASSAHKLVLNMGRTLRSLYVGLERQGARNACQSNANSRLTADAIHQEQIEIPKHDANPLTRDAVHPDQVESPSRVDPWVMKQEAQNGCSPSVYSKIDPWVLNHPEVLNKDPEIGSNSDRSRELNENFAGRESGDIIDTNRLTRDAVHPDQVEIPGRVDPWVNGETESAESKCKPGGVNDLALKASKDRYVSVGLSEKAAEVVAKAECIRHENTEKAKTLNGLVKPKTREGSED